MSLLLLFRPARQRPAAMGGGSHRRPFVRRRKLKNRPFEIDFTPRYLPPPIEAKKTPEPEKPKARYEPFVTPEAKVEPLHAKLKSLIPTPELTTYDPTEGLRQILKRELPVILPPEVPDEVNVVIEIPLPSEEIPIVIDEPVIVKLPLSNEQIADPEHSVLESEAVRDDLAEILFILGLLEGDEDLHLLSLGEQNDRHPLFGHPNWNRRSGSGS